VSYSDSSVIITGGSKGIGLSIAKVFARETDRPLVLLSRSTDDLVKAKQECLDAGAASVEIIPADITSEEINSIDFNAYEPGILINNAGYFLYKLLAETTEKEFEDQFHINVMGAFRLTQKVLPFLRKQDRGLIVNISSKAALKGVGDCGAYSMSKHALLGYTRSLREELKDTKIAVSAINLGQTYSTSWENIDVDQEKLIDPEDVGRIILSLSRLSPRSVAEEINLMPQGGEIDPV
tara:strand:- start:8926 stop:9636 length:711 start_codon:yes stop_codon:yes gene_type:complete